MKIFLNYIVIPIMVVIEVVGVSELYPIILLYLGVYITYDIYRGIKNNYYSNF